MYDSSKPGLLYQAAKDCHIDLSQSFMVGDSQSDVQCGINGGRTSVLLTEENPDTEHYRSLLEFANCRIGK